MSRKSGWHQEGDEHKSSSYDRNTTPRKKIPRKPSSTKCNQTLPSPTRKTTAISHTEKKSKGFLKRFKEASQHIIDKHKPIYRRNSTPNITVDTNSKYTSPIKNTRQQTPVHNTKPKPKPKPKQHPNSARSRYVPYPPPPPTQRTHPGGGGQSTLRRTILR